MSIPDYVFISVFHRLGKEEPYSIPISAAWRMTAGSAPRQAAIPAAYAQLFHLGELFQLTAIEQATPTSLYIVS